MTTPNVEIAMPYGVTVQGDGSNYPAIVGEHSKKVTASSIEIPAGPCRVAASWEGTDKIALQVVSGGKARTLAQLPEKAGGGRALSWLLSALSKGIESSSSAQGSRRVRPAPWRSILSASSSDERWGGGVGGGPDDGARRRPVGGGHDANNETGVPDQGQPHVRLPRRGRVRRDRHLGRVCFTDDASQVGRLYEQSAQSPDGGGSADHVGQCGAAAGHGARRLRARRAVDFFHHVGCSGRNSTRHGANHPGELVGNRNNLVATAGGVR